MSEEVKLKCAFCGRKVLRNRHKRKHHSKPKSLNYYKDKHTKKLKKIILCETCHKDIHYLFSLEELNEMPLEVQKERLLEAVELKQVKKK